MIARGMSGFLARVIRTKWSSTSCVQLHAVAHIWPVIVDLQYTIIESGCVENQIRAQCRHHELYALTKPEF
jgi:hypothetical protein